MTRPNISKWKIFPRRKRKNPNDLKPDLETINKPEESSTHPDLTNDESQLPSSTTEPHGTNDQDDVEETPVQADNNHSSDSDGNSATESSQNPPNAENTIPLASTSVPTGVNHTVQNSSHEVHIHCGSSSSRVKEENVEDSKGKQKDEGPEYISSGTQTDPVEPADPLFSPSCARPTIHRLTQCSGTTRAGLRCKLFVRVTNETCAVYCHYHKGREPSCSPDCHSQGHSGTNIRINITTSSTIQCSGINRKGTRCGLRVRPIDGATNVYCHFHIPQRIRVEEPFQTPSPSSTQWNQSETHYSAYPEIRVVTVQCSGRARTGQQCRRLLRANNNLSPTYCSQHAPQQLNGISISVEARI